MYKPESADTPMKYLPLELFYDSVQFQKWSHSDKTFYFIPSNISLTLQTLSTTGKTLTADNNATEPYFRKFELLF